MQKEDRVLWEGMTFPPLDCKILHILLELSKYMRMCTHRHTNESWELGAAVTFVPTLCVHYCRRKSTFAISVLEKTPEITLPLSGEPWSCQRQPPYCTQVPDLATPDEKQGLGVTDAPARGWGSRQVSQQELRQHSPSVCMSKSGKSPTEDKMFHIHKEWHTHSFPDCCPVLFSTYL